MISHFKQSSKFIHSCKKYAIMTQQFFPRDVTQQWFLTQTNALETHEDLKELTQVLCSKKHYQYGPQAQISLHQYRFPTFQASEDVNKFYFCIRSFA